MDDQRQFLNRKDMSHYYFDKIWSEANLMTREEAYLWLAKQLGVEEHQAHFQGMPKSMCEEAIYYCQQLLNDNRRIDLDFGVEPITPFYVI